MRVRRMECVIPYAKVTSEKEENLDKGYTVLTFTLPIEIDINYIQDFSAVSTWDGIHVTLNQVIRE